MLDQFQTFLQGQLATNSLFSGGAMLMALGVAGAAMRDYPARIYQWCKRKVVMEFEITSRDEAFLWFDEWLSQQPYSNRRARWLSVRSVQRGRRDGAPPEIILSPAPGWHWFMWRRRLVLVHRARKEVPAKNGDGDTIEREVYTVRAFTRSRQFVLDMLQEAREVVHPTGDQRVQVYTVRHHDWSTPIKKLPRSLDSVFLANRTAEKLVAYLQTFLNDEKVYVSRGVPYRCGCLLYGPPGGGKSSIVFALASHLKLDIAYLSLADKWLSDDSLRALVSELPPQSILLIEDIDCAFNNRSKGSDSRDNHITFSGLLNVLDGVIAPEGSIVIMTTNHPEKLDPALVRPGRIGLKCEIGLATEGQARAIFERFFPGTSRAGEFATAVVQRGGVSMAAIQGHLLNTGSDVAALERLDELETTRSENEPKATDPTP